MASIFLSLYLWGLQMFDFLPFLLLFLCSKSSETLPSNVIVKVYYASCSCDQLSPFQNENQVYCLCLICTQFKPNRNKMGRLWVPVSYANHPDSWCHIGKESQPQGRCASQCQEGQVRSNRDLLWSQKNRVRGGHPAHRISEDLRTSLSLFLYLPRNFPCVC